MLIAQLHDTGFRLALTGPIWMLEELLPNSLTSIDTKNGIEVEQMVWEMIGAGNTDACSDSVSLIIKLLYMCGFKRVAVRNCARPNLQDSELRGKEHVLSG